MVIKPIVVLKNINYGHQTNSCQQNPQNIKSVITLIYSSTLKWVVDDSEIGRCWPFVERILLLRS